MTNKQPLEIANDEPPDPIRKLPQAQLNLDKQGTLQVRVSGDFGRVDEGAGNTAVSTGVVSHLASLGSHRRKVDEGSTNFALGFVDSMTPKDAAETLLMTQMVAIHLATMMLARRLNHVENIPQQDAAERALNKLARTYAMQVEALKRYRTGGQQKVVVEHVTVNAGGQAIVGTVNRGEGVQE